MRLSGALKSDECDGNDLEIKGLRSKVGELTMLLDLEDENIERLRDRPPFGAQEVKAMSKVVSASEKKSYGVERVCEAWRMSNTTVYRRLKEAPGAKPPRRRPGPTGAMPDTELTKAIKQVEWISYRGQPVQWRRAPQGAHALGTNKGICTSRVRVLELMRKEWAARQVLPGTDPAAPRSHDTTIIPVDQSMRCGAPI